MSLSAKRRSELRAEAHRLSPVVIIGDKGLTDEVLAEIDRSLKAHELIKVRAVTADRDAREIWFESICEKLGAEEVQEIGKILVLYRKNPDPGPSPQGGRGDRPKRERSGEERLSAGREKQRVKDAKKRREKEAEEVRLKRTVRPRSRTPSPLPESGPPRRRPRTSR